MDEKICRLCLNAISGGDFQSVEGWKSMLNELSLNLNLDISNKSVLCRACVNNLQICSNLKKSGSVNTVDTKCVLLDIKMNKLDSEEVNDTNISSVGNQIKKICHFCRKSLGLWDYISLTETKDHIGLVGVLQKHIPEWNLNSTDELLTCYACLDLLKSVLKFITNCLDVEEKIKTYTEMRGTNGKGQIELNDVQKFTFKPEPKGEAGCRIKEDDNGEENKMVETNAEIKSEEIEIVDKDSNIKPEEFDIVSKDDGCDSFQEEETFKCETCLFETKSKYYLKYHKLIHKNPSEITMFKCDMCPYEAKRKHNLKEHIMLIHRTPSEITKTKCDSCSYVGKNKKRHKLAHKIPTAATFKCYLCPYEAKFKDYLIRHMLTHKSPSEITFKCDLCPYEAKCKKYLRQHQFVHKSSSEIIKFKCDLCPYEAKRKNNLKRHKLDHKKPTEIIKFKCDLCSYETKFTDYLSRHKLTHRSPSEITKFKCDMCPYEAKYKNNLCHHKLLHKSPAYMAAFKCEQCSYETKYQGYLNRHKLTHKNKNPSYMLQCELCPYETKYEGYLKRHSSKHISRSEKTALM